jgi:protein-tyrosine phosphatase
MAAKILMVCLGNICRSPLAEGILRSKLPGDFFVDSAATGNWHIGKAPDPRSIAEARKNGLNISNLKGRQFSTQDFTDFDFIYVMDNQNYRDVVGLAQNELQKEKVHLILEELFPGEKVDVPDPYYGGQDGFESVYAMLEEACELIASKLLK